MQSALHSTIYLTLDFWFAAVRLVEAQRASAHCTHKRARLGNIMWIILKSFTILKLLKYIFGLLWNETVLLCCSWILIIFLSLFWICLSIFSHQHQTHVYLSKIFDYFFFGDFLFIFCYMFLGNKFSFRFRFT